MKKNSFFERLQNSNWKQVLFFCGSMLVLIMLYSCSKSRIVILREQKEFQNLKASVDYDVLYHFDDLKEEGRAITFSGLVAKRYLKCDNVNLMFQPSDGTEEIFVPTTLTDVEKNNSSFYEQYEVLGFTGKWGKKLKEDVCYEIFLALQYESEQKTEDTTEWIEKKEKISTGKYFYNGELYSYNPLDYVAPEVKNAEFMEAVEKGNILAYSMENACWIYEYNKELYCIFNFSLFGTMEQRPEIPVFIQTFQEDKLPEHRKEYGRDYFGYYLTEMDYELYQNENYFLYRTELPTEYAITYLSTGVYQNRGENKGWIWNAQIMNSWENFLEE